MREWESKSEALIGRTFDKNGERRSFVGVDNFGFFGDGPVWLNADGTRSQEPYGLMEDWLSGATEVEP